METFKREFVSLEKFLADFDHQMRMNEWIIMKKKLEESEQEWEPLFPRKTGLIFFLFYFSFIRLFRMIMIKMFEIFQFCFVYFLFFWLFQLKFFFPCLILFFRWFICRLLFSPLPIEEDIWVEKDFHHQIFFRR